ncbi:MAG: phospholipase D family protein [Candidatus Omnitrophica bacterium]|nr:phospholipase D family protein [Candidatus Omnitrophota bacterium]
MKFYHIKRSAIFHRKLIIIDNKILLIGSCNLSFNGLENNKEIMVEIEDKKIVEILINIFNNDLY